MYAIYFHNFSPIAFKIGSFNIYWYSFAYIFGIIFGYLIIKFYNNKDQFFSQKSLDDIIFYSVLGIVLGGRIGFILFYDFKNATQDPFIILKIRDGGMSFHGGLIGFVISILLFCRKFKLEFFKTMDYIACVVPIGLFLGRIANFVNGEVWGRITDNSWGVIFPGAGSLPRHPSQLYEAAGEGILLFILLNYLFRFTNLKKHSGSICGLFLISYGIIRFLIEYYREPHYMILGISIGQMLCIPMIIIGMITFIKCRVIKIK